MPSNSAKRGGKAFTQYPIITEDDQIRIRSITTVNGEMGKIVMPKKSMTIGYRVRLVEAVGSKKDNVLSFIGEAENLSMPDLVAGRTLKFVHTTAKLSPAAAIVGRINLVLPDASNSDMPDWTTAVSE